MKCRIECGPSYTVAVCMLEDGESIKAEAGAMVSMDAAIEMETSAGLAQKGGLLKGLKRTLLGGESFFQNTFTAAKGSGEVCLAPALPGDVVARELDGTLLMQSRAYLASTAGIQVDTQWGGAKGFFSGTGLFLLKASGRGTLLYNSFGAIQEIDVGDEGLVVDTGHVVAFEESLDFAVQKFGSWKSFLFSGEGLVCRFTGRGKLWLQSRSTSEFGRLVGRLLPPRKG
jgi:uncharacterized protein (TIGR00266 family)